MKQKINPFFYGVCSCRVSVSVTRTDNHFYPNNSGNYNQISSYYVHYCSNTCLAPSSVIYCVQVVIKYLERLQQWSSNVVKLTKYIDHQVPTK